jgi:hypothetical protein
MSFLAIWPEVSSCWVLHGAFQSLEKTAGILALKQVQATD